MVFSARNIFPSQCSRHIRQYRIYGFRVFSRRWTKTFLNVLRSWTYRMLFGHLVHIQQNTEWLSAYLNGVEPLLRNLQLLSYSRTTQHFMEHWDSLPCSQRAGHWSLSWARLTQFMPPFYSFKTHFNTNFPPMSGSAPLTQKPVIRQDPDTLPQYYLSFSSWFPGFVPFPPKSCIHFLPQF
jgi:hypothetical protein